jgi:hypothetical protein
MSSKTLWVCIFCSLMAGTAMTAETTRQTIQLIFPKDSTEENIKTNLDKLGIVLDEKSTISIHEEKNHIDLTCFNCIVRNVNTEDSVRGSFNERTIK